MAEVASAPDEPRARPSRARLRASAWTLLVAGSLLVLVGGAAAFGADWALSGSTRTSSYSVAGPLAGVQVRVVSGDVVVVGGGRDGVSVRRTDRSTFGHGPIEWRTSTLGLLQIASRCPRLVVGACGATYRIAVPDNVPVSVRADHGSITLEGYRGSASLTTADGPIVVDGFCGYALRAVSTGGDVTAAATCSPERLELRTASGGVSATVPAGRYRIEASTAAGPAAVWGLTADPSSPWTIQALSTSGEVKIVGVS